MRTGKLGGKQMGLFRKIARAGLALALVCAPSAVLAQDQDQDNVPTYVPEPDYVPQPDYRTYQTTGTPVASKDKSVEQRDQEDIAFRAFTLSCDRGSISACFELGNAYEVGIGTPQNRPIAAILFSEGCALDHAQSCYRLGLLARYAEDEQGPSDAALAFEKACTLRHLEGCTELGIALNDGFGIAQNAPSAEALWRETCEFGESEACRLLAQTLIAEDRSIADKNEAVALLFNECSALHRTSCSDLLPVRIVGVGVPPIEETLAYGCAADDWNHCTSLADMALLGDGIPYDPEYAYQLYRRACELAPGHLCRLSETIASEPELLEKCESGDIAACTDLGQVYTYPGSALANNPKAKRYFEIACASGDAASCFSVAKLIFADVDGEFYEGPDQALTFLETSCAGEYLDACESLARELENGDRVAQDKPRAFSLLETTCEKGHINSCTFLEQLFWSEPGAPLALANSNYTPPVGPKEQEEAERASAEETAQLYIDACATSTLFFRGQIYSDKICKPVVRSIGGYALRPGQAPWQALLWRPRNPPNTRRLTDAERVLCGGSLIREGWILTAAHCLKNETWPVRIGDYRIRLGVHNPRSSEGISYPVMQVFNHPRYNPSTYAYDIALIRYNPRAGTRGSVINNVARISLDDKPVARRPVVAGQAVYAYGWGFTRVGGQTTEELRGVRLLLSSAQDCERITRYGAVALCAGGPNGEQACDGDSGGPLITYRDADRIPRVIGVVSAGRDCGTAGEVSRYTRVGAVLSWINSIMGLRRR